MNQFWNNIKPRGDQLMWLIILALSVWGLLAVYSSTGGLAYKKSAGNTEFYLFQQCFYLFMGFGIMLVVHSFHYRFFMGISRFLLYVSYALLIYTLIFGVEINGAKRWIALMGFTIQSSDFAKVAIILYVTRTLAKKQDEIKDLKKGFLPILIHVSLTCALIAPENFSTAAVLFSTCLLVMFIGRVSLKHLGILTLVLGVMLSIMVLVVMNTPEKYLQHVARFLTWKHRIENFSKPPQNDPDITYQNDHAKIAIASGGVFGKLPGNSTERNFLPEAYSDFIYAIIAEEYGFIGAIILLMLYLFFLYRAMRIILKSPQAFGALIAVGLSFALVLQALINMAVAVNLFPVTGLTLPLVSKGGTSIFFTSLAFGVIMSVSRHIEEGEESLDIKEEVKSNKINELSEIV